MCLPSWCWLQVALPYSITSLSAVLHHAGNFNANFALRGIVDKRTSTMEQNSILVSHFFGK